jgi:hypothetical protein
MHRHRSRRRGRPAASTRVSRALQRRHPVALRTALSRGRLALAPGGTGVLVTASDDPHEIAHAAWSIVAAMGGILDRRDIAERYRLSRGRVFQLTQQRHFPEPAGEVGGRPVWLAADVEHYRSHPPPVGRPPKTTSDNAA